jgi:glycosyltransferase involved in cell wall biosynthesis
MKKIKVTHISHSVGGVDVYLRLIIKNTNPNNIKHIIIHGLKDSNKDFVDINNNKVIDYKVSIFREISLINDLKAIFNVYRILKKEKPDVIHAHSAKGGIIGRLLGWFLNTTVLYTPHAFSYLSEQKLFKKKLFLNIEKIFSFGKNILLATSNSEKERGVYEVGYKKDKVILFNNCINPISVSEKLSIPKTWSDNYICTVGRPSYQKNIELMILILNEIRKEMDINLVVMGVGHHADQLESVKKLINDLNLNENVTLLEWTDRADVFNIISKSKLYLSTARYEGLPYSVIEALALSKTCVVSDCDGNRDLIEDGYNGFVIKDENIEKYKEKILLLLNNPNINDNLASNAFKSYNDYYNIEKNISKLETIYKSFSKIQ